VLRRPDGLQELASPCALLLAQIVHRHDSELMRVPHAARAVRRQIHLLDESTVHAQLPQDQLVRNRHLVAGQRRVVLQGRSANSED